MLSCTNCVSHPQCQAEQTWSLYQDDGHLKKQVDHGVNVSVRLVMQLPLDLDDCLHSKEALYTVDLIPCNLRLVLAAFHSCVDLMFGSFGRLQTRKERSQVCREKRILSSIWSHLW